MVSVEFELEGTSIKHSLHKMVVEVPHPGCGIIVRPDF